jgi:hypothetical protein
MLEKINADVEARHVAGKDTPDAAPTIETSEKAKLTPEDLLSIGQEHRAERARRVAAMTARVDAELAKSEEKDATPKVDAVEGADLTADEAKAIDEEAAARIEAVRGHEDEFQKGLTYSEKKFFAEGTKLDEKAAKNDEDEKGKMEHAHAAFQMGYKETPEGDLVRGNAVSQELGQLGREVDDLTERTKAAKGLLEATKGWWGKMKGRREVARLEKQLEKKTEELERARTRVAAPELAEAAAKARAERKG